MLTWQSTNNVEVLEGGRLIQFKTENVCGVRTDQAIPLSLKEYNFEVELLETNEEIWLTIGVESEKSSITYRNDGSIEIPGKEIIDEGVNYKIGDHIRCNVKRLQSKPQRFEVVFFKNNIKTGRRYLDIEGEHLRLRLLIQPLKKKMTTIMVQTTQGLGMTCQNFGNI